MEDIKDLITKASTLVTAIQALPLQAPSLATQADLDALGASLDAATAALKAITPGATGQPGALTVDAGPAQTITLPATAALAGTATDLSPQAPLLTTSWSTVSGPGSVSVTSPASLVTSASFSVPGTYVLRLTATDTVLTATSDVTITCV